MILRVAALVLLGYILYRLLKAIFIPHEPKRVRGGRRTRPADPNTERPVIEDEMVRDPVCGNYIPRREALTFIHGSETIHFCSRECREAYLAKTRRQG